MPALEPLIKSTMSLVVSDLVGAVATCLPSRRTVTLSDNAATSSNR